MPTCFAGETTSPKKKPPRGRGLGLFPGEGRRICVTVFNVSVWCVSSYLWAVGPNGPHEGRSKDLGATSRSAGFSPHQRSDFSLSQARDQFYAAMGRNNTEGSPSPPVSLC